MENEPGRCIVAAVQMDPRIGDKAGNLERMERWARQAAGLGARLAAFPECALTGYCFDGPEEAFSLAEPIPGPSADALGRISRELGIYLVFGLIEVEGDRLYNALAFLGPEGIVGESYRKIHLPFLGLDRFSTRGERPFRVHHTPMGRIGLNICYDAGFPESSRVLALLGADLILLPTNWPPEAGLFAEHGIITRAIENHVYYMAVNRVGEERGQRFIGRSIIVDPLGRTLALGSEGEEEILVAELEPARARRKRVVRGPAHIVDRIAHRRPDLYGPILRGPEFPEA